MAKVLIFEEGKPVVNWYELDEHLSPIAKDYKEGTFLYELNKWWRSAFNTNYRNLNGYYQWESVEDINVPPEYQTIALLYG